MSQENVDIVREVYAALNSGDREGLLALADPEIVLDASRLVFNPRTYVGKEGMQAMVAQMDEVWAVLRFEPEQLIDAGDHVAVAERLVGTGRGSGIEVEQLYGAVWSLRDGRVVRMEVGYADLDQALEAARLKEAT